MDLKLPFSVIRNEQVQIQAVLYNLMTRQVKVNPPELSPSGQNICHWVMGCVSI